MASQQGRGNGYSPEPYYFFRLILESTIRDGKLGIPRKFARDYENTLSSTVFFEVPNGQVWELELKKLAGQMWVQSGWPEFARHYSLEFGHFLVFIYQGNCRFHVLILDKSASEIHYPYTNDKDKEKVHQQVVKIEESQEDDSVQIISNIPKAKRKKPVMQCPRPQKMMRASLERISNTFSSENPFFLVLMQPAYVGRLNYKFCYLSIPKEFSTKYLMNHGDVILRDFNGKTWSAEYRTILGVDKRPYVRVVIGWGAFVRDNNLQVGDVCTFELINRNDITFRVFVYGGKKADFHGLRTFIDVCLGPSKVHDMALQRIMKVREKALQRDLANNKEKFHQQGVREKPVLQCPRPQMMMRSGRHYNGFSAGKGKVKRVSHVAKSKALERASSAFKSENPFFLVLMQPTSVGRLNSNPNFCYLCIPKEFSRKYLMDHGDVSLYGSNGKTWSAGYRTVLEKNKQPCVRLIGWGAFVRDNNLQVGDVCAFELINRTDISFQVLIYGSMKTYFHGCLEPVKVCETAPRITMEHHEKALQRALAFTSENPYFLVVLRPSYLQSHLRIPQQFAREHFKSTLTSVNVTLCLSNGNSWPVEYHQQSIGSLNARICNGWRAFVDDNKLKVGDVCVLEMMKDTQISFSVSIFQAIADEDCHPSQGVSEQPLGLTSQSAKAPLIFRRVVLPLHLKEQCVDIPSIFVEQYFKPNIEKLILQVADRSWPVKVKIYPQLRIAKLTSGWIEFVRGNSLREGDICVYELDAVNTSLLKVSISKCAS